MKKQVSFALGPNDKAPTAATAAAVLASDDRHFNSSSSDNSGDDDDDDDDGVREFARHNNDNNIIEVDNISNFRFKQMLAMGTSKVYIKQLSASSLSPSSAASGSQQQKKYVKGLLLMLFSAITGAANGFIIHTAHAKPFQMLCLRGGTNVFFCILYLRYKNIGVLGPMDKRRVLFTRGFIQTMGLMGYYFAIANLAIADAVVLSFTSPVWVALACWVFLKEPMTRMDVAQSICCLAGVILVTRPAFLGFPAPSPSASSSSSDHPTGTIHTVAFCSALLGAALTGPVAVQVRQLLHVHPIVMVLYLSACLLVFTLPVTLALEPLPAAPSFLQIFIPFLSSCFAFISQLCFTMSLQNGNAGPLMRVTYVQIVLSFLFSVILHESVHLLGILGAVLISSNILFQIVSEAYLYILGRRQQQQQQQQVELQELPQPPQQQLPESDTV